MRKAALSLVTAAAMFSAVAVSASSAQAYESWQDWNNYSVTGLDGYTIASRPFTVQVDGPNQVCSMEFAGTTLTAAPWTFTLDINKTNRWDSPPNTVQIEECDGGSDTVRFRPDIPFAFGGRIVSDGGSSYGSSDPKVTNRTKETATVTVTDRTGKAITSGSIEPGATFTFALPDNGTTERYTATATTASGASMTSAYTKAHGWGLMLGEATIAPCTTVTWAYDASKQPAKAKTFKKDIEASLAILSKETGLTFAETQDYGNAQLRYDWDRIASAGLGGTDGQVTISTTSDWPTDKYAGFKPFKPYSKGNYHYTSGPAGRGWLIVHETMHALGFDHVDDQKSIMAPVNRGQGKFTSGDLEGLHTVYRSACGQ